MLSPSGMIFSALVGLFGIGEARTAAAKLNNRATTGSMVVVADRAKGLVPGAR
jgi:hypothetical protein